MLSNTVNIRVTVTKTRFFSHLVEFTVYCLWFVIVLVFFMVIILYIICLYIVCVILW